jgi:hypothetical protein
MGKINILSYVRKDKEGKEVQPSKFVTFGSLSLSTFPKGETNPLQRLLKGGLFGTVSVRREVPAGSGVYVEQLQGDPVVCVGDKLKIECGPNLDSNGWPKKFYLKIDTSEKSA